MERGGQPASRGDEVARLVEAFEELARSHPGAVVESKPAGAAFHYRQVDDPSVPDQAREAARRCGARILDGKKVVEALFGTAHKGDAVRQLMAELDASAAVFFGDDTTDEHVFEVLGPADVGVKVGSGETLARHRVADPDGVAEALDVLLDVRRRNWGSGE